MPDFERLLWVDPRTDEQLAEYNAARTTTIDGLRAAGSTSTTRCPRT